MAERGTKKTPVKQTIVRHQTGRTGLQNSTNSVSSKFISSGVSRRWKRFASSHVSHLIVLLLVGVVACVFFYHLGQKSNAGDNTAAGGDLHTTAGVVQRVSRHILLPSGEQPTVATVTDASKVRNQAFFASSASGDKVLIYANAKKAYLYRPSIDRVIEVAPLAPDQPSQAAGRTGP